MMPRPLTEEQILAWADTTYERTGEWPQVKSGPVQGVPGETWAGLIMRCDVEAAGCQMVHLYRILAEHRGIRNPKNLTIYGWSDSRLG